MFTSLIQSTYQSILRLFVKHTPTPTNFHYRAFITRYRMSDTYIQFKFYPFICRHRMYQQMKYAGVACTSTQVISAFVIITLRDHVFRSCEPINMKLNFLVNYKLKMVWSNRRRENCFYSQWREVRRFSAGVRLLKLFCLNFLKLEQMILKIIVLAVYCTWKLQLTFHAFGSKQADNQV